MLERSWKTLDKLRLQNNLGLGKNRFSLERKIALNYRIYSNKRRCAYLVFRATSAALIPGRRLFKNCTRQFYLFYIFIQRYTFYLLIFLWSDSKSTITREIQAVKKTREFHDI